MEDNILEEQMRNLLLKLRSQTKNILDLDLTDQHLLQLKRYTQLLLDWNQKMNLTTITDPAGIMLKHFLDSFVFVHWIKKLSASEDLILGDLGSGAGFPGIPIKVLRPDINVILIDALQKRTYFLKEVIAQLELSSIETFHGRAEDIGREKRYRGSFDIVTARAVAELPVLIEYAIPLLKVGGHLYAAKGMQPEKEILLAQNAMKILNCQIEHLETYSLGDGADYRSLLIIKKIGKSEDKYPRQAGKPKKNPL